MSNLNPKFNNLLRAFIIQANREGLDVDVHMDYRSVDKQNELFAQGRTKPGKVVTNARGGLSWHNYGLAADVVFKKNGKWSWSEEHDWKKLGEIGKKCGLEWGGDWKRPDRPHFQYTNGLSIRTALRLYNQGGLALVWHEVNNGNK